MVTFAFMLPNRDGEIIGATDNPMLLDYSLVRDHDVWHVIARVEPELNAGGNCYTLVRAELPRGVGAAWAAIQARRELSGRLADGLCHTSTPPTDLYDNGRELRIRNGNYTSPGFAA